MLLIGQWILFGVVVFLGLFLLWNAARYILKLAFILALAALIVYGLHHFSLLPEPAQKYIDELFSQDYVQKVKDWMHQQLGDETEHKEDGGNTFG